MHYRIAIADRIARDLARPIAARLRRTIVLLADDGLASALR